MNYDLTDIDADAEWAVLQAATASLPVELVRVPAPCTLSALEAELRHGYHVLHFVGHGAYSDDQNGAVAFLGR